MIRKAFPLSIWENGIKITLHWIAIPDKFSSVAVSVIVLLLNTPIVELTMIPSKFQIIEKNVPFSCVVLTSHVNSAVELIGLVSFSGNGPPMTDLLAVFKLKDSKGNQTITQRNINSRLNIILPSVSDCDSTNAATHAHSPAEAER